MLGTNQHKNFGPHANSFPGSADKSYTNHPEYKDVGMTFVLYPKYRVTPNF